jgi:hypothetical protein
VAAVLQLEVSKADVGPPAGGRVNEDTLLRRAEFQLLRCPKREKTARAVHAMRQLGKRGVPLPEIRAVVSDSASSWARMRTAFKREVGMSIEQFCTDGSAGPPQAWQEHHRDVLAALFEEAASVHRSLTGWSFMREAIARNNAAEMGFVVGPDVGDPFADAVYVAWRRRQREQERQVREAAQEAIEAAKVEQGRRYFEQIGAN